MLTYSVSLVKFCFDGYNGQMSHCTWTKRLTQDVNELDWRYTPIYVNISVLDTVNCDVKPELRMIYMMLASMVYLRLRNGT